MQSSNLIGANQGAEETPTLVPRRWKRQDGEWKAAGTVHETVGPGSFSGNPGVSVLAEGGHQAILESNGL